jgi:hypothetical protein
VTRQQLEHAIRAACDVSKDTELLIFGSQAILGGFPDAPLELRASVEVDLQPVNFPEKIDAIDGALGELSYFHQQFGFYVHGVSIEAATLPEGWKNRTVPVSDEIGTRGNIGHCLEAHDLAASKLVAFRDKDRAFVRVLIVEGLVRSSTLVERIQALPIDEERRTDLSRWVLAISEEL